MASETMHMFSLYEYKIEIAIVDRIHFIINPFGKCYNKFDSWIFTITSHISQLMQMAENQIHGDDVFDEVLYA